MINPQLIGSNTKNWAAITSNFTRKEEYIFIWTWEEENWKTKKFSKISKVKETESSVSLEVDESVE